jgi:hypothetical protein
MSRPNYGTERESRRPEPTPAPARAVVDWVGICGVIFWLLAVVAALFVGVLVGALYVYLGLAALFGNTVLAVAVTPVAYLGTPCVLGGLTVWAGVVWWAGHVADRNRWHHR